MAVLTGLGFGSARSAPCGVTHCQHGSSEHPAVLQITPLKPPSYGVHKVVIDAGHGGHDHGCSGSKSKEKHVALDIALKLGAYIEKHLEDVEVIYTRKTDVFVELHERANIANRANADVFISIHCNANPNKTPFGTETYVMGLHRNDANLGVAKRENEVILLEDDYNHHYDGFDPNTPNAHIIFSLYQSAFLEQSIELAGRIEKQFAERVGRKSRGVKQAGFLVLYMTKMPAVLVETGFLTNLNEEEFLASEKGKDLMASALFRAFRDYKVHTESKVNQQVAIAPKTSEGAPAAELPASALEKKQPPAAQSKPEAKPEAKPEPEPVAAAKPEPKPSPAAQTKPETKPEPKSEPAATAKEEPKPALVASEAPANAAENKPDIKLDSAGQIYRVQIYASRRKLPSSDPMFKSLNGEPVYYTQIGELYKYAVGEFSSTEEAAAMKAQLRNSGFPDAFVVTLPLATLAEK